MRTSALVLALLVVAPGSPRASQAPGAQTPVAPAVAAGDLVYLSGMLPVDAGGQIAGHDIRAQTARTLDNLAALLPRYGSRMGQVAAVTVYLRNQADFAAMNEVYGTYWPKDPPTRTTVIVNLVAPDALIEVSVVALHDGVERRVVHPAGWLRPPSPYSYGIQAGDTLFLSGLLSRNGQDNTLVPGDMRTQTSAVLRNAVAILAAAGMTPADVVSARVFITDVAMFQDMNAVYREVFPASPPARATVRAGLTSAPYVVEIAMVAVKDPTREAFTTPNADGTPGTPNPTLSSAVRAGKRLYMSGTLGATRANQGDAAAQAREALARIGRTLTAAGFTWTDVVDGVAYLPDLGSVPAVNAAYRDVLGDRFPAPAAVGAGLVAPDGLVEIMLTAVRR
jgi:reactive intermediate/imine deaminase